MALQWRKVSVQELGTTKRGRLCDLVAFDTSELGQEKYSHTHIIYIYIHRRTHKGKRTMVFYFDMLQSRMTKSWTRNQSKSARRETFKKPLNTAQPH